jgi:hypothetical protein
MKFLHPNWQIVDGIKKLLVFVATDGVPTDEDGNENVQELERTMREKRRIETTYVSFLLCTDDPTCDDYLTEWDRTGELFFFTWWLCCKSISW